MSSSYPIGFNYPPTISFSGASEEDVITDNSPPENDKSDVEVYTDFLPLYARVHVRGFLGYSPELTLHGTVCSPPCPYYHGDHLFLGYIVKLDETLNVQGEILFNPDGTPATGQLRCVFVHFAQLEVVGPGEAPKMEEIQ